MAQINFANGEVQCKIVYYGPAESGKTANLRAIHEHSPERIRGKLTTIATDGNRTLFFDFLPLNLGKVASIRTKLNLYAVPYIDGRNALRVLVLEGVDGVVFVADARKDHLEANREALANLRANLVQLGRDPDDVPIVFQANKMDLEDVVSAARLADALDLPDAAAIDAMATEGTGVLPSLKAVTRHVLDKVAGMMGGRPAAPATRPAPQEPAPEPAPATVAAPDHEEPAFTPAWHRSAPEEPGSATSTSTGLPATPAHTPSPAIIHGNTGIRSADGIPAATPPAAAAPPAQPEAKAPPSPAPLPVPVPAKKAPDLKKTTQEAESPAQWDDGPITDPFLEASSEEQPFPAFGGGMAVTKDPGPRRPGRAVSVGAGGTRGRARAKTMPAFGWGPVETKPNRRGGDRPRQRRPKWRVTPPTTKQMTAGAMATLAWLAVTGFFVLELL